VWLRFIAEALIVISGDPNVCLPFVPAEILFAVDPKSV